MIYHTDRGDMTFEQARIRSVAALLLITSTAGCFTQHPLPGVPAPMMRVVATVTDSGTISMGNAIGPGAVEVEGIVARADETAWSLHLIRVDHRDGRSLPWNRELVTFPRHTLGHATERRLDRTRSWLAAGAITVAAVLAGRFMGVMGGDDSSPGEPVPPEMLRPGGGR